MMRIKHSFRLAILVLCPAGLVQASGWNFTPYITLGEIYTDNVTLAPDGAEQDDFVTFLNPGFSLRRDKGRVKANVAYQMQNLFYASNSDFNDTFHRLDALGEAEVLRDHFYIDAASSVSQQVINAQQAAAISNHSVTDNRSDVITASVSPYVRQKFGSSTQALARYRYGIVNYNDDDVEGFTSDANVNSGLVALGSPPEGKRLSWLGAYNYQRVNYDSFDTADTFQQAGVRLDYQLARAIGLVALGGYEDDKFERETTGLEPRGTFWEAGLRLDPGPRDLLEARYGERFFGNTYFFSWAHTGRRFATQIAYSEDVTTLAQSLLGDSAELLEYEVLNSDFDNALDTMDASGSAFGANNTINPGTGLPVDGVNGGSAVDPTTGSPLDGLSLTSAVYVAKRLDANIALSSAKTDTRIEVFQEDRDFKGAAARNDERAQGDERVRGIQALLQWHFAARTDFFTGADYAREHFSVNDSTDDLFRVSLGLQHLFGSRTYGRLAGVRTERNSDDNLDEYTENAVILSVARSF